jgi:hypothetical protein
LRQVPLAAEKSSRGPEAAGQVRDAGNETGVRRKEMRIAMSNVIALVLWRNFRFLDGGFTSRDFSWLVIGALLAAVLIWAFQRQRRRWF